MIYSPDAVFKCISTLYTLRASDLLPLFSIDCGVPCSPGNGARISSGMASSADFPPSLISGVMRSVFSFGQFQVVSSSYTTV